MRISDIQPQYFPRLHYFARMLASDVFVIRDEVQFVRNHKFPDGKRRTSHQAHALIKGPDGERLLAVSVTRGGLLPIRETRVSRDQPWARKHLSVIHSCYRAAPNYRALAPGLEALLGRAFATLADLDIATIAWALHHVLGRPQDDPERLTLERVNALLEDDRAFRLKRIALGSDVLGGLNGPGGTPATATATERIVTLCAQLGADEYLGGRTAVQAYADTDLFARAGVALSIQDWTCPIYPQQHVAGAGFVADLSILDLLMNAPPGQVGALLGEAAAPGLPTARER